MSTGRKWKGHARWLTRLMEKHRGACALCGRACLTDAPENHPRKATIDHVVPLWRGGDRGYANCQLACYSCNHGKGLGDRAAARKRNVAKDNTSLYRLYPNGVRLDVKP